VAFARANKGVFGQAPGALLYVRSGGRWPAPRLAVALSRQVVSRSDAEGLERGRGRWPHPVAGLSHRRSSSFRVVWWLSLFSVDDVDVGILLLFSPVELYLGERRGSAQIIMHIIIIIQ
jgi:hypothetical protein